MALYAIGDLHLSLGANKPMDVFGGGWNDYVDKIKHGFANLEADDVCVLCGDISWGMSFEESLADFKFIDDLPGKKIILKGNHDYWWSTLSKMNGFFRENGIENIEILSNNSFRYENIAICGTRGWLMESQSDDEHDKKIMAREVMRLEMSLKSADEAAEKLCFFHYPPRFKDLVSGEIVAVMEKYGVKRCWYGHIHGHSHRLAVQGERGGITYNMVSADYVGFVPRKII